MRYFSVLLVIICFLCLGFTYSPSDINFTNKSIQRVLKKSGLSLDNDIEEIKFPDSIKIKEYIEGKYFRVAKNNENQYRFIYIGRVNSCRAGGCEQSVTDINKGGSEYFDYFIIWDSTKRVKLVNVFNYQATHGQEITSKGWLKQYRGFNSGDFLEVGKNIDAISGATISVHAITDDIQAKTRLLQNM